MSRLHRTWDRAPILYKVLAGNASVIAASLVLEFDAALRAQMRDRAAALFAPARGRGRAAVNGWKVDIGAGTELRQCAYKAPGGFLRAVCEWHDGRIVRASLSGDFFCYPPGGLYRLEAALVGVRADPVVAKINDFYRELGLVTPGIRAAHWAKVLAPA